MKLFLSMTLLAGLLWAAPAQAEEFCAQLQTAGLEGRLVKVTLGEGTSRETIEGRMVTARPGILILQLSGSRSYVNCAKVRTLVVAEAAMQRAPLTDTIESIWKSFGE